MQVIEFLLINGFNQRCKQKWGIVADDMSQQADDVSKWEISKAI